MRERKMASGDLTPKQDSFCLKYIECSNQSEAYRHAYPRSLNWKPETVHNKASHMMRNAKVKARIEELKQQAVDKFTVTYEMKEQMLWEMAMAAKDSDDINASRSCIAELNKMAGDLAPTKTDNNNNHNHNGTIDVHVKRSFKDAD